MSNENFSDFDDLFDDDMLEILNDGDDATKQAPPIVHRTTTTIPMPLVKQEKKPSTQYQFINTSLPPPMIQSSASATTNSRLPNSSTIPNTMMGLQPNFRMFPDTTNNIQNISNLQQMMKQSFANQGTNPSTNPYLAQLASMNQMLKMPNPSSGVSPSLPLPKQNFVVQPPSTYNRALTPSSSGYTAIIGNPPSASSNNKTNTYIFNPTTFLQQAASSTPTAIPPSFFSSIPLPHPQPVVLPSSTKGLLEVSPPKLGKKWPKLLSEIKLEVIVTNQKIWQSMANSESLRCYVPDFGSEFDEYEDDDLDDDDDMFEEDFNNIDEDNFDLNKYNGPKKSQGTKRSRDSKPKQQSKFNGNTFVYLFSPNRELVAYVPSAEYNECLVPLAKHKIVLISATSQLDVSLGKSYISLKIYMVKKAMVSDKNLLESNVDGESGTHSMDLSDEQVQLYHIRKNFLKRLFELIDRQSVTSFSSSNLQNEPAFNSKARKLGESDVTGARSKQEEDDLDGLDDTDLDEYIIQKPASNSSNRSDSNPNDKSLERQLEELYEEIEKTIVDDENAPPTEPENSDDEPEGSHHDIEIPEDSVLAADLRSYQKTAVKWMLKRERVGEDKVKTTPKLHSMFQERKFPDGTLFYFNPLNGIITTTFVPAPPEPKGGILADEMGLGKTVEVIGLIASNRMKVKKNTPQVSGDKYITPATLVVTPLTIIDQWKQEIERHTNNQLSVCVYQGSRRIRDAPTLLKYDVIITTYNTLSFEFSQTYMNKERTNAKKKAAKDTITAQQPSPIYRMKFFRVVLDEAHNIKNRKSLQAKATAAVDAERRWAVTGTPIQNHIDDLFSLFHFLKVNPHGDWRWWSRFIGKPFEKKDKKAVEALQSVIKKLVIRRTKNKRVNGKRIVMLPPKRVETVSIQFSEAETNFYKSLYEYSKGKFNEFLRSGTVLKNYANILEMLLHLRQVCNHPALIITSFQKKSEKSTMNGFLENFEQKNGFEVYDSILPMLPQVLKMNRDKNKKNGEEMSSQLKTINVTRYMKTNWRSSSKINALIEKLRSLEHGTKSVVFSQWTSMLDLVEIALEKSNIKFVRLDGKMQRKDRDDAVQKFKADPYIQVCLISLKVGGTGLNLVWATHVFLLDPWWNPAIEEQAIDRVHRIGQDKPVTVFRFVVKDSVEERILSLQKSKTKIANEALNFGSDDDDESNTTYTTSFLGSFGGGALKRQYDSDEYEDDDDDEFKEVTLDDLEDEEDAGAGSSMFGHTKKDAQKIRIKDLSTIFI